MTEDANVNVADSDVVFVEQARPSKPLASPQSRPAAGDQAVVGATGRYTLSSWRDANGNARIFDCSVLKMTARAIELSAPVTGTVGEWVCAHFDKLGKFEGPIIRTGRRSLVMRIVATAEETSKVAAKIAWIADKSSENARRHPRFVPFDPNTRVMLPDGSVVQCQIVDYSVSGAAITTDHDPSLGSIVRVGNIIGNVVRCFNGGFAVEFTVLQQDRTVEDLIKASPKESDS